MATPSRSTETPASYEALEELIRTKQATIGVIGLGYVGLPLVRAFASCGFRCLGFDVDQVSVQQPQLVTSASARADIGGNSAGTFGRDASSFQSWGSSNGENGAGGQAAGRGRENGGGRHETHASVRQNSAGGDIYI